MAQQEYARAMGEDDLKTDAMKGMAKALPYDRAFQRTRPDWLDIQPVRRIRSGSLVGPGKRTICSRIEAFWSQDCIWTWLIHPDALLAPLLLRNIFSLAQIPHGSA